MRGFWVGAGVASLLVTGLTAPPVAAAEPAADTTVQAVRAQCEPHDQRDLWPGRHADPRRVRFDQDRGCGQHCPQRLLRPPRGAQGHQLHPSRHAVRHLLRPAQQPRRRQRKHGRHRGATFTSGCQVLHPPAAQARRSHDLQRQQGGQRRPHLDQLGERDQGHRSS